MRCGNDGHWNQNESSILECDGKFFNSVLEHNQEIIRNKVYCFLVSFVPKGPGE